MSNRLPRRETSPWLRLAAFALAMGAAALAPSTSRAADRPETITDKAGITLVLIPAGEFLMGTTPANVRDDERELPARMRQDFDDEQPQHRVRITRPFYLGITEVTIGQFRTIVRASGLKTEAERRRPRRLGLGLQRGDGVVRTQPEI